MIEWENAWKISIVHYTQHAEKYFIFATKCILAQQNP
jgi:hypothetical protein